jgi:hypothetical protein
LLVTLASALTAKRWTRKTLRSRLLARLGSLPRRSPAQRLTGEAAWKTGNPAVTFEDSGLSEFDEILCDPADCEEIEPEMQAERGLAPPRTP